MIHHPSSSPVFVSLLSRLQECISPLTVPHGSINTGSGNVSPRSSSPPCGTIGPPWQTTFNSIRAHYLSFHSNHQDINPHLLNVSTDIFDPCTSILRPLSNVQCTWLIAIFLVRYALSLIGYSVISEICTNPYRMAIYKSPTNEFGKDIPTEDISGVANKVMKGDMIGKGRVDRYRVAKRTARSHHFSSN